jgi:Skp family chaperone for outer membrane proteins
MEQILSRLLAEMNDMREKVDSNKERMEAKIGAEIKAFREKMDSNQELSEASHREWKSRRTPIKKRWTMEKRK